MCGNNGRCIFSGASLVGAAPFLLPIYYLSERDNTMGTNNTNKNNKNPTDVIGVISALAGLATAATPLVVNAINNAKSKSSEKSEEKIKIPELYHKGFPIDLSQAVKILEDCGLKSSTSKLTVKEANPRYRDCFDSQVIGSNPKQGTLVRIGSTVCLRYIPEEVILESQKIFDEMQRSKIEAKERTRENFSVAVKKTKRGVGKIFKRGNKVESIKEDVSDE